MGEGKIRPSLEALQKRLRLSDEEQLRKLVLRLPAVLGYSFKANLEPKLAYLEHELGISRGKVRDRVLRMPALLGYSIEKRYAPRLAACRLAGRPPMFVLDRIVLPDERFYALVAEAPSKPSKLLRQKAKSGGQQEVRSDYNYDI